VYVIYEGDTGGRRIPRQELPPELRGRYPYNAAKAADYRKQQADKSTQEAISAAERNARLREAIERGILDQIEALTKQDVGLQKEKKILKSLPPGNGRRVRMRYINDHQESIRAQIERLREKLDQIRSRANEP
jgi:hypothetical protein